MESCWVIELFGQGVLLREICQEKKKIEGPETREMISQNAARPIIDAPTYPNN